MDKIITEVQERKKTATRLTKSSKLFKTIIKAIQDKKGASIASLDLKKIDEAVADYFVLSEGSSNVHVKAIAQNIVDMVELECDERPYHIEFGDAWTLIDYVNIVIHVFQHEQRAFYNLESLWEDAPKSEY